MQNASLTISNPYVLYRSLLAIHKIRPDPAQARLALHLSKLYDRLKDYEPTVEYSQRLQKLGRAIGPPNQGQNGASPGLWQSLLREKERRDSLALTRVLSDHEEALRLDSPRGLMVHGEVGTGKSMLIDLFAECLPTRKKRRWHFNTFMLDTFRKLEKLRIARQSYPRDLNDAPAEHDDHSMLLLARELIETSPILFLDEFQLPDRASAKIMTNLMTGFFGLGGVLVATSNRMPDELAKAAGIEFVPPVMKGRFAWSKKDADRSSRMFAGQGEFAMFLELLKARCDVWEMEGKSDYRRVEDKIKADVEKDIVLPTGSGRNGEIDAEEALKADDALPTNYFIQSGPSLSLPPELIAQIQHATEHRAGSIPWQPSNLKVYGRTVPVPRSFKSVALYTFSELCGTTLGPADYISLASTFHTIIITDVPVLVSNLKNEARRFITLLDALYEAKCKLLISAQVGPDDLFFPDLRPGNAPADGQDSGDAVYPETFSDIHQDLTAPFRPNVSLYSSSEPNTTHSRFAGILAEDALEDDPPNRVKRMLGRTDSNFLEDEKFEVKRTPDFAQTGIFTGEDERFAYKRATSRLWEMCGRKWWDRVDEGWWKPLPAEAREWEWSAEQRVAEMPGLARTLPMGAGEGLVGEREVNEKEDEIMYKYSPFRTSTEEPPKIGWTHAWGMMKWGKKAGAWGQGVEGLKDRKKDDER